jgi:cytoskeletal protein CcmA (bactofilin family)
MKNAWPPPRNRMKFLIPLVVCMLAGLPLQAVQAQGTPTDGLIPAGETIEGSVFLYAPQVRIEGTVDGDVFAISPDVVLSGEVKGDLFVLSNKALIDGILGGNLYSANSRLNLGSAARVGRSVYAASLLMNMPEESKVENDLYLLALGGELSGSVGRDQRAYLGLLEIWDLLFAETDLLHPFVPSDYQLPSEGAAGVPADVLAPVLHMAPASGAGITAIQPVMRLAPMEATDLGNWLLEQLQTLAPMLLIGLLLVWLFPRFLGGSAARLRSEPGNSLLSGVVTFFVGLGVAVLATLLIVALGLFFSTVQLTDLAWTVWMAGFGGLSVALASFYFSIAYLSKVIVAYLFGTLLLGRISRPIWGRPLWTLLLGEAIVLVLLSISILGGVVSILITMFGLGTIYLYFHKDLRSNGKTREELPVSTSTAGELLEPKELTATAIEPEPEESSELAPVAEMANRLGNSHGRRNEP